MSCSSAKDLYEEIKTIPIVDIHTHVDWKNPVATGAWQILSYHYFTEQAHSQGMSREYAAPEAKYTDRQRVEEIAKYMPGMSTTEPYHWLIHLSKKLFGFADNYLDSSNWETYWNCIKEKSKSPDRLKEVVETSNIEIISLTNMPWEALEGVEEIKNSKNNLLFIPTFRVDALILDIKNSVPKIAESTNLEDYQRGIKSRLDYFVKHKAKSCAASLGPSPLTLEVDENDADIIFREILNGGNLDKEEQLKIQAYMIDYLAGLCQEVNIPFQLMIGARRNVYKVGVPGGEDLPEPQSSLIGLEYLLNKYPQVKFPISVLSPTQDRELATYARIFSNVYASGHWWFENTFESIKTNLTSRLKLAPHKKLIGQYSDAYISELIEAKIDMYRRVLSEVLAEYVTGGKLTEKQVLSIAQDLLYNQPKKVFDLE